MLGEEWFRAIVSRITLALHPGYWLGVGTVQRKINGVAKGISERKASRKRNSRSNNRTEKPDSSGSDSNTEKSGGNKEKSTSDGGDEPPGGGGNGGSGAGSGDEGGGVAKGASKSAQEMADDLANQIGKNSVTFRTPNKTGHIDLRGRSHFDKRTQTEVPTPHVQTRDIKVGPDGQISAPRKTEITLPATKQDIRTARELARRQGLLP